MAFTNGKPTHMPLPSTITYDSVGLFSDTEKTNHLNHSSCAPHFPIVMSDSLSDVTGTALNSLLHMFWSPENTNAV